MSRKQDLRGVGQGSRNGEVVEAEAEEEEEGRWLLTMAPTAEKDEDGGSFEELHEPANDITARTWDAELMLV